MKPVIIDIDSEFEDFEDFFDEKTINLRTAKLGANNPRYGKPSNRRGSKHTSEAIELNRQAHLGIVNSPESIKKVALANTGKKRTAEQKANMSAVQQSFSDKKIKAMHAKTAAKNRGQKRTAEQLANMRGKVRTPEMIAAMVERQTGKTLSEEKKQASMRTCPHCGLVGRGGTMTRYHFDKCNNNPKKKK